MTNSPVSVVRGTAVSVRGNDIDTDRIIPARFMKVVTFEGLGQYAFYDVRFDEEGNEREHPFNDPERRNASILVVNKNFGCGSSREHAPQALAKWGIDAVVGESFAEIFAGNCTAMGIPTITLSHDEITDLMDVVEANPDEEIEIDLKKGSLTVGDTEMGFFLPPAYRNALLGGSWDSTATLLQHREEIEETARRLPYLNGFETPA
jgi:3-isopropylmalate/(R)-2-methylmalate dehydratase small subunit